MSTHSERLTARFWSHVDRSSKDGCWPWTLKPDAQGYGQLNIGQKRIMRAHRLSYLLNIGEIPEGLVVMHRCDNRICVRPDHLTLGTQAENLADCRAKGRWHNQPKPKRGRIGRKGPEPRPIADRLWEKVDSRGGDIDQCWPFTGFRDGKGYGLLTRAGSQVKTYAHREAYRASHGPIPDGLVVMHTCDNPPCCNPNHLRLGTRADNNRDRSAKGRGRESRQFGADNPRTKLTDADVAEIKRLRDEGWTQFAIAAKFGIKQPQVSRIVRGVSWKALTD